MWSVDTAKSREALSSQNGEEEQKPFSRRRPGSTLPSTTRWQPCLPGAAWRAPVADFLAGILSEAVTRLEEAMIRKARREAAGNQAAAVRQLGIHRQLLYSKIKQYDLDE